MIVRATKKPSKLRPELIAFLYGENVFFSFAHLLIITISKSQVELSFPPISYSTYIVSGHIHIWSQESNCWLVLMIQTWSSWWLNQPIWKICSSTWIISPGRGENKKYVKPPPSDLSSPQNKTPFAFQKKQNVKCRLPYPFFQVFLS